MRVWMLILMVLMLAACGDESEDKPDAPPTTLPPATQSPVLVHLQRDYEALRESHQTISDLWEHLADQQQVQCGTYPDVLSPDAISADDDPAYETLAATLDDAAILIDQAVTLWRMECDRPGGTVSSSTIQEGLLNTRSAGDRLDEAGVMLSEIQG